MRGKCGAVLKYGEHGQVYNVTLAAGAATLAAVWRNATPRGPGAGFDAPGQAGSGPVESIPEGRTLPYARSELRAMTNRRG